MSDITKRDTIFTTNTLYCKIKRRQKTTDMEINLPQRLAVKEL